MWKFFNHCHRKKHELHVSDIQWYWLSIIEVYFSHLKKQWKKNVICSFRIRRAFVFEFLNERIDLNLINQINVFLSANDFHLKSLFIDDYHIEVLTISFLYVIENDQVMIMLYHRLHHSILLLISLVNRNEYHHHLLIPYLL